MMEGRLWSVMEKSQITTGKKHKMRHTRTKLIKLATL